jgi:hypothetical protein
MSYNLNYEKSDYGRDSISMEILFSKTLILFYQKEMFMGLLEKTDTVILFYFKKY